MAKTSSTAEQLLLPLFDGERLLSRAEVCDRVGKTFATIWAWMQAGKFPRSRTNTPGGVPQWLESEVVAWMRALPVKPYKADAEAVQINAAPIRAAEASAESRRRSMAAKRRNKVRAHA